MSLLNNKCIQHIAVAEKVTLKVIRQERIKRKTQKIFVKLTTKKKTICVYNTGSQCYKNPHYYQTPDAAHLNVNEQITSLESLCNFYRLLHFFSHYKKTPKVDLQEVKAVIDSEDI